MQQASLLAVTSEADRHLCHAVQRIWKDGPWAEKLLCPAECLIVIPDDIKYSPAQLAATAIIGIPYGGLLKCNLRPGQSVIINGGTGQLGSLGALLALALGMAKVCFLTRMD